MEEEVLFIKRYIDLTDERDKNDIYSLSLITDTTYKGEFRIENLAIYYALTIYCDIKNGEFVFNEAYFQDAYDKEYKKNRVDLEKIPYYAEDLDGFINEFIVQLNNL